MLGPSIPPPPPLVFSGFQLCLASNFGTARKGFWFAHTCACSLYMFLKTLADFPQLKMKSTQR